MVVVQAAIAYIFWRASVAGFSPPQQRQPFKIPDAAAANRFGKSEE